MYKVGDKVVVVWPNNIGPDGEKFAAGRIDFPPWKAGDVLTVARVNNAYGCSFEGIEHCWLDNKAIAPYKEESVKDEYEGMTFQAVYAQAMIRRIPGRSNMTKAELIAALKLAAEGVDAPAVKLAVPVKPAEGAIAAEKAKPAHVPSFGEQFAEEVREKGVDRVCSYAYVTVYGNKRKQIGDVCHARLRGDPMKKIVLDIGAHHRAHSQPEEYKKWVEWVINKSPVAQCFLTKSFDVGIKECLSLDVSKSHSWNVTAAIFLRMGSEYPHRLEVWSALVNEGVNPSIAWLLMSFFVYQGNGYVPSNNRGGHDVVSPSFCFSDTLKFIKKGLVNPNKPSNQEAISYSIFESVVTKVYANGAESVNDQLIALSKAQKNGAGWAADYKPISLASLCRLAGVVEEKVNNVV